MKKLITSALPYVNNVPHLGNLIQVLSADVFARYSRLKGDEVLYVCGTDEYGTATETKAQEEGISPMELCNHYHTLHKSVYESFGISFDYFGRTSIEEHTGSTQEIFLDLYKNGYIKEHEGKQFFCSHCKRFLADRYITGSCPHCGKDARGDQCENCGKLLEPTELIEAKCSTCHSKPILRDTRHLYIDLPKIFPIYNKWLEETLKTSSWAHNAVQITKGWIKEGLEERAITRDLKWGIPVPLKGYEDKVFYVWFDAPIGYISLTKHWATEMGMRWEDWWLDAPDVKLFQFIGKDNIPFHTVIFPSSLIGTGRPWTKLYRMSSTEYLNYEDGKFSKSKGIGVFGTDAIESDIPIDMWRFYIFYNRPEKSDYQFTWKDMRERVNSELIGNLCNLVNRTLTFVRKYYDGVITDYDENSLSENETSEFDDILTSTQNAKKKMEEFLEAGLLKEAFHEIFLLSDIGNKAFQKWQPWKGIKEEPVATKSRIRVLCNLIKDILILSHPFMPQYASEAISFFGKKIFSGHVYSGVCMPNNNIEDSLKWTDVGNWEPSIKIEKEHIIFKPLDSEKIEKYRKKFSGKEAKPSNNTENTKKDDKTLSPQELFLQNVILKVARVLEVTCHPDADRLYIIKLDDGMVQDRVIVSALRGVFSETELLGKNIIIVDNLKPRKMRGVTSHGMLLVASSKKDGEEDEVLELLTPNNAPIGERVLLKGMEKGITEEPKMLNADLFFSIPIKVTSFIANIEGSPLIVGDEEVKLDIVKEGNIG